MFIRRVVGGILIAGLLLGMTGCGDSGKNEANVSAESVYEKVLSEDISGCIYREDPNFSEIKGIGDFTVIGDNVYYYQYDNASDTDGEDAKLYKMDMDGKSEFLGDIDIGDNEYISMMVPSAECQCGVIVTDDNSYRFLDYNGQGILEYPDVSELFKGDSDIVLEVYSAGIGTVVVTDKRIILYDLDFVKNKEIENKLCCSCLDKNGNIVVAHNSKPEGLYENDSVTTEISVYDCRNLELINTYAAKIGDVTDISAGSGDNDLYIYAGDIYGLSYSDKTETKLVSIDESGIVPMECQGLELANDNTLFVAKNEYAGFDVAPRATLQKYIPKTTDQTASVSDASGTDSSDEQTVLTMDGLGDMSLNQAIAKGMLENITPYMEADEEVAEYRDVVDNISGRFAAIIQDRVHTYVNEGR